MVGENEISVTGWAYWANPDTITAYSTLALFIVTVLLVIATALSVLEVRKQAKDLKNQSSDIKRQADAAEASINFVRSQSEALTKQARTMESQFEIIREESATMTRQANAMEGQSRTMLEQASAMKKQADAMEDQSYLMLENMEYDRLVRKYERVSKEMSSLVGPLYGRRKDAHIFSLTKYSQKVVPRGGWQSGNDQIFDFMSFWDLVDQNIYLNRSSNLKDAYMEFIVAKDEYYELSAQVGKSGEAQALSDRFNKEIKIHLINLIEERYVELAGELRDIERELKVQEEKT